MFHLNAVGGSDLMKVHGKFLGSRSLPRNVRLGGLLLGLVLLLLFLLGLFVLRPQKEVKGQGKEDGQADHDPAEKRLVSEVVGAHLDEVIAGKESRAEIRTAPLYPNESS